MSISNKLLSLRVDNDLTQEQLAAKFKVERKTISRAETGVTEPKISLLILYARYFNVSLDYIADLTNIPKTLDGTPYRISKNITVGNVTDSIINIKN